MGNLGTTVLGGLVLVFFIYLCLPQRQKTVAVRQAKGRVREMTVRRGLGKSAAQPGLWADLLRTRSYLSMHLTELWAMRRTPT